MKTDYEYALLKSILNLKLGREAVWKKRIQNQTQLIHLLEETFGTDITTQSFGFYPNNIYFSTPLTSDPEYTKKMKPTWQKIKKMLEKLTWDVYAPFDISDPHAKMPDNLTSYQIRDLDHIRVLTAEVAIFDFNRPSHGVGQEVELSVFMPKVGFSQAKVSRMVKGMPGMIVLNYMDENDLLNTLKKIFRRTSYKAEPFYLAKCSQQPAQTIFKGGTCLNCEFSGKLHAV